MGLPVEDVVMALTLCLPAGHNPEIAQHKAKDILIHVPGTTAGLHMGLPMEDVVKYVYALLSDNIITSFLESSRYHILP